MTDQTPTELFERRLSDAFRHDELPPAPASLRDALERVVEAPVDAAPAPRRAGRGGMLGILGIAAVLLVGGAVAFSVGSRPLPSGPQGSDDVLGSGPPTVVLTYEILWTTEVPYSAAALAQEIRIVQGRLDAASNAGTVVTSDGQNRLVVHIPPELDLARFRQLAGQTGRVDFVPLGSTQKNAGDLVDLTEFPPLFGSEGVSGATIDFNQTGQRVVNFTLSPSAAALFGDYTAKHIGSYFAIAVDGQVLSAPVINTAIPGGNVQIEQNSAEGGFPEDEARALVAILDGGPLPAALQELSIEPAPSGALAEFSLQRAPADLGCDAIAPPYSSFVLRIDAAAAEPVWAVSDRGARLGVQWGPAFRGLVGPPPTIVDNRGVRVASDQTTVVIPAAGWPSLAGWFVCPGAFTVYVVARPT